MTSKTLWTKTLSEEFWSGIVTPLMFSLAGSLIEERMAKKGVRLAGLKALEEESFFRLFCGQVYLNCRIFEEIVRLIPSVFITPEMLQFLPPEIQGDLKEIRVAFFSQRTIRLLLRLFNLDRQWAPFFNYKAFEESVREIEEAIKARSKEPLEDVPLNELIEKGHIPYRRMGDFLDVVTWGMVFAYVFHPLTQILARKWGGDESGELASHLTVGLEGIKTFEINREIELLAERVSADRWLSRLFQQMGADAILRALMTRRQGKVFFQYVQDFLQRNGHRFHGRDVSYPTWRERPEIVIDMIKKHIGSDRNRKAFARQKERRRQTEDTLRRRVREGSLGPVKLSLFSLSLLYSQKYFVIRENMRYYSDVFLEEFRRIYLEIGRRWQQCGKLEDSTDIFYLTKEEIEKGVEHDDWIKEAVRKRKEDYQRFAHLRTPQVISDDTSVESLLKVTLEWRQELEGQVASPGHVRAPARVVSTSEDMIAFKEGEILVTQYADPSWTPILSMAGGLVLEVGGFLSHGSIVAREYGIPAVINVTHATEIIKTGDMLVLDSFRGSVRIESAQ